MLRMSERLEKLFSRSPSSVSWPRRTRSLCPECLKPIEAELVLELRPRGGAGMFIRLSMFDARLQNMIRPGEEPAIVPGITDEGPIRLRRDAKAEREKAIALYIEARKYFELKEKNDWLGRIDYQLGLLHLENLHYHDTLNMFNSAKLYLQDFPKISEDFDLTNKITRATHLLYSGNTLKYRLKIPAPELIEQSDLTLKIYELISIRSTFDIIKGLRNLVNVQISTDDLAFDSLKGLLQGSNFEKFEDDNLEYTSELYEDIGNLFLKDGKHANAYFYFIASQILYTILKNSKRAEKNEKKLLKLIQSIAIEDNSPLFFDLLLYQFYQIAKGSISISPKEATKSINSGLEIARKKDNPFYEGLFKELLGDIRKEKDIDKAMIEYQSAITIYESLEAYLDLLRIYEKLGTELLSTQTDKAKEILGRALDIAQKIKDETIISRIKEKI